MTHMKRLILLGVLVASCSFLFFNWLQSTVKRQELESVVLTAEQEEWLKRRLAVEENINALQRKVILLQEKYERVFDERRQTPHWSAADARIIIQEIEASEKFAASNKCTEPNEYLIPYCKAYKEAVADREWWGRLTMISVQLSAAQYDLAIAKIQSGELGDNAEAAKRLLMKHTGTA